MMGHRTYSTRAWFAPAHELQPFVLVARMVSVASLTADMTFWLPDGSDLRDNALGRIVDRLSRQAACLLSACSTEPKLISPAHR